MWETKQVPVPNSCYDVCLRKGSQESMRRKAVSRLRYNLGVFNMVIRYVPVRGGVRTGIQVSWAHRPQMSV